MGCAIIFLIFMPHVLLVDCQCHVSNINPLSQFCKKHRIIFKVNGCVCDTPLFVDHNFTLSCDFIMTSREASVENCFFAFLSPFCWQWQLCILLHCPLRSTKFRSHAHTQVQSLSSTFSPLNITLFHCFSLLSKLRDFNLHDYQ